MRRFLPPALLLLLAAAISAWVFLDQSRPRQAARNEAAAEAADGPSVRAGARESTPLCAPKPEPAAAKPAEEAPAAAETPEKPFIDDDPVVAQQTQWVADYSAVQRGGARVEFEVTDAKGKQLERSAPNAIQLLRKVGRYWVADAARFDVERRVLVCDGYERAGLEPGEYELFAAFGPYGVLRHEFRVARGETRRDTLATPCWRRIITLHFIDQEGKAIPALPINPSYSVTSPGIPQTDRGQPGRVLRDPPAPATGVGYGGASSVRKARGSGRPSQRWLTDEGRWYLRVFVGAAGTVSVPLFKDLCGIDNWTSESTFTGAEWDNFEIRLNLAPNYLQTLEASSPANEADPGNRSLLTAPINPPPEPQLDLHDIAMLPEGHQRLIITVAAPFEISPAVHIERNVSTEKNKNLGPQPVQINYHQARNAWWIDLPPDTGVWVEWRASSLFPHVDFWSERVDMGKQRIVEHRKNFSCTPLSLQRPSPTLSAMAANLAATMFGTSQPKGPIQWQPDGSVNLWVQKDWIARLEEQKTGSAVFGATDCFGETSLRATFALTSEQARQMAGSGASVKLDGEGLILRAVGPGIEGLPWVEGTVVSAEEDIASKRMRKAWQADKVAMEECYNLLCELATRDASADHPSVVKLGELLDKLPGEKSREMMRRCGAWYDTRFKLRSDCAGYMVNSTALTPGKRYVLYLWCNSRDEFMPDRRIDFVASEGITDLGAIMLPGFGG